MSPIVLGLGAVAPVDPVVATFYPSQNTDTGHAYLKEAFPIVNDYMSPLRGGGTSTCMYRFRNVTIPQGATILSAQVSWALRWFDASPPEGYVDDADWLEYSVFEHDNATVPASRTELIERFENSAYRSSKLYKPAMHVAVGVQVGATDISPGVQSVISRPGWESGNNLMVMSANNPATVNGLAGIPVMEAANQTQYPRLVVTYLP